ncbi:MAG: VOC family protein [Erythrobacter sp.]
MPESLRPFHLAFPVDDLEAARRFYGGLLECAEERSDTHWIDFDFFGHQITAHKAEGKSRDAAVNAVDEEAVPIPHFGIVLTMPVWDALALKLKSADIDFIIEPTVRFKGKPGEQATMFLRDPAGNALEFKGLADDAALFATEESDG